LFHEDPKNQKAFSMRIYTQVMWLHVEKQVFPTQEQGKQDGSQGS
jgi:hypothetical protein